jgi:hypothetical protein
MREAEDIVISRTRSQVVAVVVVLVRLEVTAAGLRLAVEEMELPPLSLVRHYITAAAARANRTAIMPLEAGWAAAARTLLTVRQILVEAVVALLEEAARRREMVVPVLLS